jgi:glucose-1-phosphate cytidylyltransferase
LHGDRVSGFAEKPPGDGAGLINGGFFVLSPCCLSLIDGDDSSWEGDPIKQLARQGQLMAFEHRGFWRPMDTLRDKIQLEELWASGNAPWKIW